ncbi:NAD(P)-dependent oxidoreductase [Caenimonas soli]|uniref:NAD(P)-dependent oxidoreductase n=1 Tax=Caenimonas soli TaxID=2735555 RepID=UPI0015566E85|nr:NAD(P)-dependent oxidoreductase [Caenimonas soli]NPC58294.1 NAD(P)-dependent oxidoreductase [Caenimonas soli]
MAATEAIAFIGIGNMGWPMAERLLRLGHLLVVSDASQERAARFAQEHGCRSATAGDALPLADVIVTMLPTSAVVEEVLCRRSPALRPGALVIEMSSGVPASTRAIAEQLTARGVRLIDAPVSGGVKRAMTGELAIMCGGAPEDVDRATPLLRLLGSSIVRTGAVGSAHAMKALNNLVSAVGFVAGIEALLIGRKFGLDPALMVDVLNASSGMNNSTQKKFKQFVLSSTFDSGFGLDLMAKDISIALDLAQGTKTAAPLSAACRELWSAAAAVLGPGRDHTEMARLSEMLAGVSLAAKGGTA